MFNLQELHLYTFTDIYTHTHIGFFSKLVQHLDYVNIRFDESTNGCCGANGRES